MKDSEYRDGALGDKPTPKRKPPANQEYKNRIVSGDLNFICDLRKCATMDEGTLRKFAKRQIPAEGELDKMDREQLWEAVQVRAKKIQRREIDV